MSDFKSDVKTLNNSAFYPGCGNDFDLIWNPPTGAEIENWVLCDWPAWENDGVLVDVFEVNLEKVFCEKVEENDFQIIRVSTYTKEFNKRFKDFEQSDNPPSYISEENGFSDLQKQKKVLFYEVEIEGQKKNIWLLLGYEGLTLYRSIYCGSRRNCQLYVRKFGVGTKGSQGEKFTTEASGYLVDLLKRKAPTLLADIFIVGRWLYSIPPFAQIAEDHLSFTPERSSAFASKHGVDWMFYSNIRLIPQSI